MDAEILKALCDWAKDKKCIQSLFIFGSRAKNTFQENSDLDLAIEFDLVEVETAKTDGLSLWIMNKEKWQAELISIIPFKIDLQWVDTSKDNSTPVMKKALSEANILVYRKEIP